MPRPLRRAHRSKSPGADRRRTGHQGVLAGQADLHQPPYKKQIDEARSVQVSSLPDPEADQARVKEGTTNGWS